MSCSTYISYWLLSPTLAGPHQNRMSRMLAPTSKAVHAVDNVHSAISHNLLLRAGYIRQSSAGMYSFLPLALRVLAKIERIIDEEMQRVGGQKLSLPCLLPSDGWKKTGRWESTGSEMFKVTDRKGGEFCLAPTHEEEITQLVSAEVSSWKQLPLRLYQIGRKYRDEARPRSGLLRAREFIMKDLYSFDATEEAALATYDELRNAYDRILKRIGIPFAAAEADSGNIGGTRSHEYHFLSTVGEDTLLTCNNCGYTANEERAVGIVMSPQNDDVAAEEIRFSIGRHDQGEWCNASVTVPSGRTLNPAKLKAHPALKGLVVKVNNPTESNASPNETKFFDHRVRRKETVLDDSRTHIGDFIMIRHDDGCSICNNPSSQHHDSQPSHVLQSHRAIEIGHTFFLGTKYSASLGATFKNERQEIVPMQMGCFGIGVTRMMAAVVEASHDQHGIIWPESIAPYRICIVPMLNKKSALEQQRAISGAIEQLYSRLENAVGQEDIVIDDREEMTLGFKMKDAALIGYPYMIVLGKTFLHDGLVEVHIRRTEEKRLMRIEDITDLFNH
ncbi:proline---tRNA ligase [Spizellomyces sp. 'palustris']|nr:proline---tRNA ligase [Spizellomyces sp. 'palustris']